jgi:hypothetical protein
MDWIEMRCGIEVMEVCCWKERNRAEERAKATSRRKGNKGEVKQARVTDVKT